MLNTLWEVNYADDIAADEAGHVAAVIAGIFMFGAALVAIYSRLDGKGRFYPEIYEGFLFIVLFL